jgi:hypothetical protein
VPWAPGGEWRERFLTLTIPHSGDIERDVAAICVAWRPFRRRLWRFFAREHGLTKALLHELRFVRVLEVTPGQRDEGHAHLHVYLLCPYIPHEFARHAWGEALSTVGYKTPSKKLSHLLADLEADFRRQQLERVLKGRGGQLPRNVYWPVVDLRECYGDVERELVKYLIKDAESKHGELGLIDAVLGARIYKALEGVRTIATSRGFMGPEDKRCTCTACGCPRFSRRAEMKPGYPLSPRDLDDAND